MKYTIKQIQYTPENKHISSDINPNNTVHQLTIDGVAGEPQSVIKKSCESGHSHEAACL